MYRLSTFVLLIALLSAGCKTSRTPVGRVLPTTATIADEGFLTCFGPGTAVNGQPVWCEVSAVLYDGSNVLLANDKDVPTDLSPVFTKPVTALPDSTQAPFYLMPPAFTAAHKYEDFAQTPDGRFVFLTTAFDRVKAGSHDWDGYNTILYWRKGDEQHPHVLASDDTSRTSVTYRQRLSRVLADADVPDSVPYFKIEGLAVTDRQFLFGIREVGKAFDSFKPVIRIVAVSYRIDKNGADERIRLGDDWRVVANFDPASVDPSLPKPLSLSSLEFDPQHGCFWLLTSLETPSQLDAYLWAIRPNDLLANKPFTLVRDAQGQPLRFGHKAEDLTPLDANQLLIIHDDDRVRTTVGSRTRQPNQAAYTTVTIR